MPTLQRSGPLVVISTGAKDFINVEWLQDFFDKNNDDVLCRFVHPEFVPISLGLEVTKDAHGQTLLILCPGCNSAFLHVLETRLCAKSISLLGNSSKASSCCQIIIQT